jgi:hypothetical protein
MDPGKWHMPNSMGRLTSMILTSSRASMMVLSSCKGSVFLALGTQKQTDFGFDPSLWVDLEQPSTFPVAYESPAELDVVEAFQLS